MFRMTKQTDYGIVLLTRFASAPMGQVHTARDLSEETLLPLPMVSKILKVLGRYGLLVSHRGVKGGYSLARRPEQITMIDIVGALEGPVAITECSLERPGACTQEPLCPVRTHWQRINQVVRDALAGLTLAEMTQPLPASHGTRVMLETVELSSAAARGNGHGHTPAPSSELAPAALATLPASPSPVALLNGGC
ncbi:MAG: SUF system Fe-S cluster assembly regulator [Deltaproteobacteria bacterium]|nr:SUF system Fe-S cluster assembly regulator [Deltaproteobacteria bacterium]